MSSGSSRDEHSVSAELGDRLARRVFLVLHGYYGSQWTDKFRSGMLTPDGQDAGVLAAQAIWAKELEAFEPEVVKRALDRVKDVCRQYPPSLPEFLACVRAVHRPVIRLPRAPEAPAPMPEETRQSIREIVAGRGGVTTRPTTGLPVLLGLVSHAVGLAGGDEVATLMSLERAYPCHRP